MLPEPASYDGEWTSYDFSLTQKGTNLLYSASWTIKDRLAPPEAFDDLDKLSKAISRFETEEVVLSRKGVSP